VGDGERISKQTGRMALPLQAGGDQD